MSTNRKRRGSASMVESGSPDQSPLVHLNIGPPPPMIPTITSQPATIQKPPLYRPPPTKGLSKAHGSGGSGLTALLGNSMGTSSIPSQTAVTELLMQAGDEGDDEDEMPTEAAGEEGEEENATQYQIITSLQKRIKELQLKAKLAAVEHQREVVNLIEAHNEQLKKWEEKEQIWKHKKDEFEKMATLAVQFNRTITEQNQQGEGEKEEQESEEESEEEEEEVPLLKNRKRSKHKKRRTTGRTCKKKGRKTSRRSSVVSIEDMTTSEGNVSDDASDGGELTEDEEKKEEEEQKSKTKFTSLKHEIRKDPTTASQGCRCIIS